MPRGSQIALPRPTANPPRRTGREYQRLLGGEVQTIYDALDDGRNQLLEDEAARLIAEQRAV
jgi:hypothetical protein